MSEPESDAPRDRPHRPDEETDRSPGLGREPGHDDRPSNLERDPGRRVPTK